MSLLVVAARMMLSTGAAPRWSTFSRGSHYEPDRVFATDRGRRQRTPPSVVLVSSRWSAMLVIPVRLRPASIANGGAVATRIGANPSSVTRRHGKRAMRRARLWLESSSGCGRVLNPRSKWTVGSRDMVDT